MQAAREEVTHQRELHQQQEAGTQTPPATPDPPIRENHGQHDCPICLATAQYAVQTNCGHLFCGKNATILRIISS